MGTPDYRFEVSCNYCGVLEYCTTLEHALRTAKNCEPDHKYCSDIMVFDLMAHKGKPEIYNPEGTVRSIRLG